MAVPTPRWGGLSRPDPAEAERRSAAVILGHWLGRAGGEFPRNYMVFDVETSGPDAGADLILNVGHVIVEDGVVTQRLDALLDWTREGRVDQGWLRDRMAFTRRQMAGRGREYKMHYETLAARGEDPVGVLRAYCELVEAQRAAGFKFVMHNGYNFDAPRLCNHFRRWLSRAVEFGPDEIWDTGMIEKALQLNAVPDRGESMRAWSRRVGGVRAKGVMWVLDAHCVPKYGLVESHGLDESEAHGAGYDAYVTHLLFEVYRRMAAAPPG